jgi:hypothetical protein
MFLIASFIHHLDGYSSKVLYIFLSLIFLFPGGDILGTFYLLEINFNFSNDSAKKADRINGTAIVTIS